MPGMVDLWPANINQGTSPDEHPAQPSPPQTMGLDHTQGPASATSTREQNVSTPSTVATRNTAPDVMDTNLHTSNLEFYGSASSVAFLRHVETLSNYQAPGPSARAPERSLAELLYNTDFHPDTSRSVPGAPRAIDRNPDRFYFRVARRFLDAYFSNIHYIQPMFEEELFLTRCEDLWFDRPGNQPLSFVALYYATLSLGSLVMTFETPEVSGADRFTWSRKLFTDALAITTRLGTATDLEMVQCYYMIAKICQHELNPHVAYLYSGQAARIALAIGINRIPVNRDAADPRASTAASKTWWAVYCLDVQTSFALGRPDSLGPDQYHTQCLPTEISEGQNSNPQVLQIVPSMVGLSRIMRKVALDLYTRPCELSEQLQRAKVLDHELELWFQEIPVHLDSEHQRSADNCLKPLRLASYIKKQSVVLRLRYLNLRMVTYAVFMIDESTAEPDEIAPLRECQTRCIQSAENSIDLIFSTFRADHYFQTWWYNSTYTLFAVSILLTVVFRQLARSEQSLENLFNRIDRAIAILQAMDDCLVARNAAAIITRTLARAKRAHQPAPFPPLPSASQDPDSAGDMHPPNVTDLHTESGDIAALVPPPGTTDDSLGETADDMDWLSTYALDDGQQSLFWTKWAHEMNTLGT
ncbi:hypothetical protein GQ53DRAFT_845046 [Thozetella sp. PMI_491]|nr:hypothetical protein GQ53DRAFT_845046 [Thozetella sp. PMI_491]